MKFLKEGDKGSIKTIDASVKNKWSWKWSSETIGCYFDRVSNVQYTLGECIQKIDVPGVAWCVWCSDKISYGSNGKKHLIKHCNTEKHLDIVKTRASNYMLDGAGPSNVGKASSSKKLFPIFKKKTETPSTVVGSGNDAAPLTLSEETADPLVPILDRASNIEAMILGYIAEHSLPLSLTDSLTVLVKEASRDPKALNHLALSKQTSSNKVNFGLGKTFSDQVFTKLQSSSFSLNIDEASNDHGKKILSLIVSFFDETEGSVVVHHLSSVELVRTDAKSIYNAIVNIVESNKIPWSNLTSVLLDSCNVMRGAKAGVETLLKQKCPNLLDIDGDSCHHVHNFSKALCESFDFWLERLFVDLHLDFKYCTQYRKIMAEICRICHVNFTAPKRFVSHRWLNAYDQAIETSRLFDLYVIFYSAFLPVHLRGQYAKLVDTLVQKVETHAARERVRSLLSLLRAKQPATAVGKKRKDRILDRIFINQEKTLLHLNLYQAWMFQMKKFVLRFQTKEPLIHKLHDEQLQMTREFLVKFIQPKFLRGKSATDLKVFDLDKDCFCRDEDIFLGSDTRELLGVVSGAVQTEFLRNVKQGYLKAGKLMLKKLPLDNPTLEAISFLNPDKRDKTGAVSNLNKMASLFSHILTEEEKKSLGEEILSFVANDSLQSLGDGRIDLWWESVKVTPILKKVAKAALAIFHGPQVESSFSLMKDIMNKKSGSMAVSTFSSIQTIKYFLKSKKQTSVEYFHRPSINHTPVSRNLVLNMQSATKTYASKLAEERQELDTELQLLKVRNIRCQTASEAKSLKEKAIKIANKQHSRKAMKRKSHSFAGLSQPKQKKRC